MVVADVTEEVVEGGPPVRELIQANGNDAIFLRCDVSRGEDVDAMFACVLAQPGRVDILVNNAAIRAGQPLAETDEALWDRMMAVNLKALISGLAPLCARCWPSRSVARPEAGSSTSPPSTA